MLKRLITCLLIIVLSVSIIGCVKERDPSMDETYPETIPMDEYEAPTPPAPPETQENS